MVTHHCFLLSDCDRANELLQGNRSPVPAQQIIPVQSRILFAEGGDHRETANCLDSLLRLRAPHVRLSFRLASVIVVAGVGTLEG
jgi:hypothetical protein